MPPKSKILCISTAPEIKIEGVLELLRSSYEVQFVQGYTRGSFLVKEWLPDIVLLLGSSEFPNLQQFIRHHFVHLRPPVFIFDEPTPENEEMAFTHGADHFFSPRTPAQSILWRSQAVLRQRRYLQGLLSPHKPLTPDLSHSLKFQSLEVFPHDFYVRREGRVLNLTPTQFKLVHLFVTSQEQLLSRDAIKKLVWGETDISLRSIDAQISKLKKIIPELEASLINIYGKGYMLSATKAKIAS